MSYLNSLRLHFAGTFMTDPSTLNNTPGNYDPAVTQPNPLWNPDGKARFDFIDVKVTRVCYADGSSTTDPTADPLVGMPLRGTNNPFPGKIVDLDPDQQMVSQIWAFELMVGALPSTDSVTGRFLVAPFNDLWVRRQTAGRPGMPEFSAYYQSVLENLAWAGNLRSRFLQEVKGQTGSRLSIKFNVDMYNPNSGTPGFTHGRVSGTIGPAADSEPSRFVAGRLLRPMGDANTYFAQCGVDNGRAYVDLGNSLATDTNGALLDQGPLQLMAGGKPVGAPISGYAGTQWYEQSAGVVAIDLAGQDVSSTPLTLSAGGNSLLSENSAGAYLRADDYVFRLDPGDQQPVRLMALRFGRPAGGETIEFAYTQLSSSPSVVGLPLPAPVTTGADGWASATLVAGDPGHPRPFIDGQVYGIQYTWPAADSDYRPDESNFLSVRVFDRVVYPDPPTWQNDIDPVFSTYAKLYPIMKSLGLGEYQSLKANAAMVWNAISQPLEAPQHMPVTRDLSAGKRAMFKAWMDAGCPH